PGVASRESITAGPDTTALRSATSSGVPLVIDAICPIVNGITHPPRVRTQPVQDRRQRPAGSAADATPLSPPRKTAWPGADLTWLARFAQVRRAPRRRPRGHRTQSSA